MFNYVVGLGQGGSRIAAAFQKFFDYPAVYFNFSKGDFSNFKPKGAKYVLTDGGTGRDPGVGEDLANEFYDEIASSLTKDMRKHNIDNKEMVLICVGGGGGSGCGLLKVILPFLVKDFENVFLIYTLPEKRERLPAKPNSLKILNWVIERFLKNNLISVLLVDNEYAANKYPSDNFRFSGVNRILPKAFNRFFKITDFESDYDGMDFADGYSALDYRELKKVLFYSKGFSDIRSFQGDESWLTMEDNDLRKAIRTSSMFVGSFDINTSKIALCCIALPYSLRNTKGVSGLIDKIFDLLGRMTKAPVVFNSSFYDKKIKKISVTILLGGLIKSKSLESLINQAIKDQALLNEKEEIDTLDLTELSL